MGWILQTITPQCLVMSHTELWWHECLLKNLKGKVVDSDNAFLNGDLEHEIYMKIPEGHDEVRNQDEYKEDCLILQKAIYGWVKAARLFWKKNMDKMQGGGFQLSEADPCMSYKEDEKGGFYHHNLH